MSSSIYYRITGHVVALVMHSVNAAVMLLNLQHEHLQNDPEIQILASMQSRFLTVWNIGFQLAYSSTALTCDILTLTNKEYLIPKGVKKFRYFFFSSVVFPCTMLVFTLFWPFYIYDRNIIFPEYIDKVFSLRSNLVMHLAIVPVVLWELAFQPRSKPKSHTPYIVTMCTYNVLYNVFLIHTYQQRGLWPYPLMKMLYGTIYNVILHAYIGFMMLIVYYMQWPISELFWRKVNKNKVKSKVK